MSKSLVSEVAELAVAATSPSGFRRSFIDLVGAFLGADHAAYFCMDGQRRLDVVASLGEGFLVQSMPRFLQEMTSAELQRSLAAKTVACDEVHETARRDRLALYREFLGPHGIRTHVLRMWPGAGRLHWFAFGFASPRHWSRGHHRVLDALDEVFPVVALAECALLTQVLPLFGGGTSTTLDAGGVASSRGASDAAVWVGTMLNRNGSEARRRAQHLASSGACLRDQLVRRYQLTETESRWALHLSSQPGSARCAAEQFGVSLNTAKTHLKRIYEKTNTHRQAELVKVVLQLRGETE